MTQHQFLLAHPSRSESNVLSFAKAKRNSTKMEFSLSAFCLPSSLSSALLFISYSCLPTECLFLLSNTHSFFPIEKDSPMDFTSQTSERNEHRAELSETLGIKVIRWEITSAPIHLQLR
jgi:hypothetical protein